MENLIEHRLKFDYEGYTYIIPKLLIARFNIVQKKLNDSNNGDIQLSADEIYYLNSEFYKYRTDKIEYKGNIYTKDIDISGNN